MLPSVVVIVISNNDERTIYECLIRAGEQTYQNKDLFIIDNSDDNSWKEIQKASEVIGPKTTYNKVDKKYNTSQIKNFALNNVSADIYAILPGNVVWNNDKLEKCVDKMIEYQQICSVVYNDCWLSEKMVYFSRLSYNRDNLINIPSWPESYIITKNMLDKVNRYNEQLIGVEDYDVFLKCTENSLALHIPEPLEIVYPKIFDKNMITERQQYIHMALKSMSQRMNG